MAFERTPLGQENRRLFMNVDAVVYVEGGSEGDKLKSSLDIIFWNNVFKKFSPDKKYRFLPKGSKPTLCSLAKELMDNNISNVYIAMDADYDEVFSYKIDHPQILYTFGYSWENDAWNTSSIKKAFFSICSLCENDPNVILSIEDDIKDFERGIFWVSYIDALAVFSKSSAIPRDKYRRILENLPYGKKPKIDSIFKRVCAKSVDLKKLARLSPESRKIFSVPRHCIGHLYEEFCYRYLAHIVYLYDRRKKVGRDQARSLILNHFGEFLGVEVQSEIAIHYGAQFQR